MYFPLQLDLVTIADVLPVFMTMAATMNVLNVTPFVNHVLMEIPVTAVELQILKEILLIYVLALLNCFSMMDGVTNVPVV